MKANYQSDINEYSEIMIEFSEKELVKAKAVVSNLIAMGYQGLEMDLESGYWSLCAEGYKTINDMKEDYKDAKKAA